MLIRNKFNGYSADGVRLYHCDGGSQQQQQAPTSQNVTQTTIPEYARPYVEKYLGKAEAIADLGYQPYGGQRVAQLDPFQLQAQQNVANMSTAQQLGTATQMAGLAGLRAGDVRYDPSQFSFQSVNAPNLQNYQMQAARTGFQPNLQTFQMGGPERVGTQSFLGDGTAEAYMSPYQQAVTDVEKREATRQSNIMGQQQAAQAAKSGAFGGSRQAIVEAERQRNLGQQLGDIQARGSQGAFGQAQQQFNAEQQARLQAALANQQAGLTTGQQNLAAQLGVQQLGTQAGLQTALANLSNEQQANVQNLASQLQTQGLSADQAMRAALANQQAGLESQRLGEQSRQFGANLGMQGIQQQLAAAGMLGNLGQMEFGQQKDIINALNAAGAQRQGIEQQKLDLNYQDFMRQQQYPYQQLGFMFDALRGLPLGQYSQSTYQKDPSLISQGVGGYLTGKGLGLFAEGGKVNAPAGLADLALMKMRS